MSVSLRCWFQVGFFLICFRSIRRNGTCIRYPEDGICFPFLNSSVPQFRDTPRFIDYYIGLNGTELLLKKYHKFLDIIAKDAASEGCLDKMRILLCQYILTPCSEESFPIPICRRECDRFEKRCPKTFQKLLGGARIDMSRMKVNLVHVDLTDCNNLGYEEDLAKVGKKCYASGIFSKR